MVLSSAFAENKRPADVYVKVQHLNEGLVSLLRQNIGKRFSIRVSSELLQNEFHARHVFQLALDIELKLIALMRANGVAAEKTRTLLVRPYSPAEVFKLLERLHKKINVLLSLYHVIIPRKSIRENGKKPEDVYHLLERMDKFLLKMGAPATQPGHVLRRASAIAILMERLCNNWRCSLVKRTQINAGDMIIPMHVYQETYRFINALNTYVKARKVPLKGGVLALPPKQGLVTPAQVNALMGITLADTIAVSQYHHKQGTVDLREFNEKAMPRDVWREINYARRLLDTLNEN